MLVAATAARTGFVTLLAVARAVASQLDEFLGLEDRGHGTDPNYPAKARDYRVATLCEDSVGSPALEAAG